MHGTPSARNTQPRGHTPSPRPGGPNQPPSGRPPRPAPPRPYHSPDAGEWAYEHKVGLLATVIFFLLLGIVFVSAKIAINSTPAENKVYIDMQEVYPPPPVEELPLSPEEQKAMEASLREIRSLISDENGGKEGGRRAGGGGGGGGDIPAELAAQAEAMEKRLAANREAYERGLKEEQAMIDTHNANRSRGGGSGSGSGGGSNGPNNGLGDGRGGTSGEVGEGQVKVSGPVSISFSLAGRWITDPFIPTYQCEGGGQVVVNIVVNRNGNVINASISNSSQADECFTARALEAAKKSRFNVDTSAPEKQPGTLTYLFAPQ